MLLPVHCTQGTPTWSFLKKTNKEHFFTSLPGIIVPGRQRGEEQARKEEFVMLYWALVFLVIAIIAAIFGFAGIAGTAAGIAKILFIVFLVLFVISLLFGGISRRPPVL